MTEPKQTGRKKADNLVGELDRFAIELLTTAREGPVENRAEVFKEVARWVSIKNRLDSDEEGTVLDGYRAKLASPPPAEPDAAGRTHSDISRQGAKTRWGGGAPDTSRDRGGSALDAIKSRLPRTNPRDAQRHLDAAGGKDDAADRNGGGV